MLQSISRSLSTSRISGLARLGAARRYASTGANSGREFPSSGSELTRTAVSFGLSEDQVAIQG